MGKRSSQRKNADMTMDSDDDDSASSSSTAPSDHMSVWGTDGVQVDKESVLEQALDALYEKRGSTREKALAVIVDAFSANLQHQFVEEKFATLFHQCLNSIKKGPTTKEVALACRAIGLLALTVGSGDNALEILEDAVTPITQALKSRSDAARTISLLECLAVVTFVGANDPEQTERSMQIMWQLVHPKLGSNVVAAKPPVNLITAVVSAWAFLLTTIDGRSLSSKDWQGSVSYLSGLLEKDDRSIRIAAGEALAVIFEMGSLEKFVSGPKALANGSAEDRNKSQEGPSYIQGLKSKVLGQVRDLSTEAAGKGSAKKDLNNQRIMFKDIKEFLEDGYCPETSMKIGGDALQTSTWSALAQLNFLKHFLGGGFVKHMQDNEFLQDLFAFMPKRKNLQDLGNEMSGSAKKMYRSPNSILNKARTQYMNKQRMQSEGRNVGHYAVNTEEEA